jgi:hypothetical protein
MGAKYFYNQHIKTLETSGTLVGHQTVETSIHTQILPSVRRFDIICVLYCFPVVVVVVVVVLVVMMMECFPFTDFNNSPILVKIPVMC